MTPLRRLTIVTLVVVGLEDLIALPFMVAAYHSTPGTPPLPAIVAGGIITVLTLTGAVGLMRASRWAWRLSLIVRVLDMITAALGVAARPSAVLTAGGAFSLVVSVLAVVLLFRLRREERQVLPSQSVSQLPTKV
jgi:hypothetical protein